MAKRSVSEVATGVVVLAVTAGFLIYAAGNTGQPSSEGMTLHAKFGNIGSLATGAPVKLAGVSVGRVVSTTIDPKSYEALVSFTVQPDVKLPTDSSAQISSGGLLGGSTMTVSPGGNEAMLADGGTVTVTQSATNLEDLLGKFIFNVGSLADATQKSLKQNAPGQKDGQEQGLKP